MAKSKNGKQLTPKEIKELEEFEKEYMKLYAKANGTKGPKKNSKKYNANRGLILRLKAAAAIMVASLGAIQLMTQDVLASNDLDEPDIYTLSTIVSTEEQQNSKIEVDGKEIELDYCSIAIVQGQIQEGKNNVFAFDKDGNILEGSVSSENLDGAVEMTEEELKDYVIYQVVSLEGTDLIQTGEEVSNVSYGDFVLGKEQHDEYVDVLYPTEEGILRGEIDEKSLEIINEVVMEKYQNQGLIKMVVDTSIDEYAKLNFRTSPNEEKYSIMMQIPNGTIIDATGETIVAEGREWTKIEYQGHTGWVASEYLKEFMRQEEMQNQEERQENQEQQMTETQGREQEQEQEQQEEQAYEREYFVNSEITNMSGGVTIIDVSTMSAKQLRMLLENGIPTELSTDSYGRYDTQAVAGDINGVQIKLGASSYGKGEFKQSNYDAYKDLVAVCEELGVSYGFYYYSTATNMEEAKKEIEYVNNAIKELEKEFDMEYNKLPLAWDRELTGTGDRQYGKDVTDILAYQINRVQSDGISEKVLLYCPGRVIDPNSSDNLLDLEKLKDELNNPEEFAIWLCAPSTRNGNQTQSTAKYIDMIENKYQISVVNEQRYLDMNSPTGGKMDINSMDLEYFKEITQEKEASTELVGTEYDER